MSLPIVEAIFQIIAFLFAISVHESAHAWMASRCGDPTARMLGRVTLNPLKHIDPFGTVILPLIALLTHFPVIGWAKPTPVNPRNFRNPMRDDILTSVAGPISNLIVATCAVVVLGVISLTSAQGKLIVSGIAQGALIDTGSALVPLCVLLYEAMIINVLLAVFNLIPIPPLDGSHVLRHFLPASAMHAYQMFGTVAFILLFLVGGRFLGLLMMPFVNFFNSLLLRM
jgi:Zn-dependent protease